MHFLNVKTFLSSIVFNNKLLKEQESTLVVNTLSELDLSDPQMRCVCLFAIIALLICDYELHYKALLQ
jgi:hypothetical protein